MRRPPDLRGCEDTVCEILAAAFPKPRPFSQLVDAVGLLEAYGLGGFGWGVAWIDERGHVQARRDLGRFVDQGAVDEALGRQSSERFLIHLRRPSRLSTVALADTQPFVADDRVAFCHNGFLENAEELRRRYSGRLSGRADSEVGWVFLLDRLASGTPPELALMDLDRNFGGKVNLGYLGADGTLAVYARNDTNAMWSFRLEGADFVSSALHSDDESVFDRIFPGATHRRLVKGGYQLDPVRSPPVHGMNREDKVGI